MKVIPAEVEKWRKQKRRELLSQRNSITPEEHELKSSRIINRVWDLRDEITGTVGLYCPFKGEVDIRRLIDRLLERGHSLALPVVVAVGEPLQFKSWKPDDPMTMSAYGIPHPSQGILVEPDCFIVPVVGFDCACYRLGYGGGYYDRTLAGIGRKVTTIGLGFEEAALNTIYPQHFDVPLGMIVTERRCIRIPKSRCLEILK